MEDNFGTRLKKVLYTITPAEQWNASNIARSMGLSHQTLYNYLNNKKEKEPTYNTILNIITYIKKYLPDFDTDYLFMQSDTMLKGNDNISKVLKLKENTIEQMRLIAKKDLSWALEYVINNEYMKDILITINETYIYWSEEELNRLIDITKKNIVRKNVNSLHEINGDLLKVQFTRNRQADLYTWYMENAFKLCINEIMTKTINKSIKNKLKPYNNNLKQIEQHNTLKSLEENEEYQKLIKDKTYIALCYLDSNQEALGGYRSLIYKNLIRNPLIK